MADYLADTDPYRHLITTSAAVPDAVWQLPQMDLTQSHIYGDGAQPDLVSPVQQSERGHARFGKPFLVGEMGLDYKGSDTPFDPHGLGTAFHDSLWAGLAGGTCGTAMYWWWDNYVGPADLWHEFAPVAAFARQVDWAGKDFRPLGSVQAYHANIVGDAVDLTLYPAGGWGDTARAPIIVPVDGRATVKPPRFVCGPNHSGLSRPVTFDVSARQPKLGVAQVSDAAVVRVSVDGEPVHDFLASALPGMPGVKPSKMNPDVGRYSSQVDAEYVLDLPAGRHRVAVAVVYGDWVTLSHVTFTRAVPARYAYLGVLAVQDAESSETLLWLRDERSNWQADRDDQLPAIQTDVEVVVPNAAAGAYECQWFDTRTGHTTPTRATADPAGGLRLKVPPFTRDVAVRITR